MLNIEESITLKYPSINTYPSIFKNLFFNIVKNIIYEKDINEFLSKNENVEGIEFVDAVLEFFDFGYTVSSKDKENIPTSGKVVIIANHPLGALDALALIKLVSEVRRDIKIVSNDMLNHIKNLNPLLLPIDNMNQKYTKESIKNIYKSLENDEVVIIFPSGEVSRARPNGIKDTKWQGGFLKFTKKSNAPILPIYIEAKNSYLFYAVSSINKSLSTILLAHEMFNKKSKTINFKVGELIPHENIFLKGIDDKTLVSLLRKHLYKISKDKKGIFATQKCIVHPQDRQLLKKELSSSKLLGETFDNKKIYLYEYQRNSVVLREIGRLREFTFRKVGEGSGEKKDNDSFDYYYKHIVLWDDEALEIVGAYRIGESNFVKNSLGSSGFYTNTLFNFSEQFDKYLINSIELGRSFVQPKYWGSRALDYLWFGIGAYLRENSDIKYLFGGVSLSNSYPKIAKEMIVYYYKKYYGDENNLVVSKNRFLIDKESTNEFENMFDANNPQIDFAKLKKSLSHFGLSVPTLYKQYSELCEDGGVKFLDFGVDKDFSNCIDGFILVDVSKIKVIKRKRYIDNKA
ncbi:MAG: lysophospholipid acyltransferase family protein [Campylobacterales bacterium]|nr:lysophospholipid acyltransferase family protein [Campylobacterales bacterium]